jgi:Skp family chaperone for outer membrane proteins
MDPVGLNSNDFMIKSLEQTIDQIVNYEMTVHKVDPSKSVARQVTTDFQQQLAKISGEVEQAQAEVAASSPQESSQANQKYVYWKSQLEFLQGEKAISFESPAGTSPADF